MGVSENQDTEPQEVMEEARVRCTCCKEQVSEVFVYKRKDKNVEYSGEKNPLNHKDTVFKDKFAGCINTEDGKCEIEILDGIWFEPNEDTKIGDGYEVDEENSYMICQKGYGMIYITDSGQVRGDMEERLGDELLDRIINEEAFREMGWLPENDDTEALMIAANYEGDFFKDLKNYMKSYGIENAVSIKMFLATIRHETGGKDLLESDGGDKNYYNNKSYKEKVRGTGLMQLTGKNQKKFLEYINGTLDDRDPMKEEINKYIKAFSGDGTKSSPCDNSYNTAQFIATNYPIESATWYWGEYKILSYSGNKKQTLNELVVSHLNDNQYNTFAVTQMKINGTEYYDYALDRFCECNNNCTIEKREGDCGGDHQMITDYCFKLKENDGSERHDYGPNNWTDREKAYDMVNTYFNKVL